MDDCEDSYGAEVAQALRELGIPETYGADRQLTIQREARETIVVGRDVLDREFRLTPKAASAWKEMQSASLVDGIVLHPISGFRSLSYQIQLIRNKLEKGQLIHQILRSSAAPGYSEHHTGDALDITTPGAAPLTEEFETTMAFAWLTENARRFGFRMSFPRDNPHGIIFEPWHWCWRG